MANCLSLSGGPTSYSSGLRWDERECGICVGGY